MDKAFDKKKGLAHAALHRLTQISRQPSMMMGDEETELEANIKSLEEAKPGDNVIKFSSSRTCPALET